MVSSWIAIWNGLQANVKPVFFKWELASVFFSKPLDFLTLFFVFSLSDEANVILCLYKSGSDEFIGWGPSDG